MEPIYNRWPVEKNWICQEISSRPVKSHGFDSNITVSR